jgi:hypothetical protein
MLEYVSKYSTYGAYGGRIDHFGPREEADFYRGMLADAEKNNCKGLISTAQPARFMKFRRHLLGLDCDDPAGLDLTLAWLKRKDIRYSLMESSPRRHWVLCEHVDTWGNTIDLMRDVPGVDRNHVEASRQYGRITFRAFPKLAGYPRPADAVHFLDLELERWLTAFRDYYRTGSIFKTVTDELVRYGHMEKAVTGFCPECGSGRVSRFCASCGHDMTNMAATVENAVIVPKVPSPANARSKWALPF